MTPREPRVGIGLPVRDGERFVAQAIESVLAQTYGDFELVVWDNASRDATEEIARSYEKRDPRVRVRRSETDVGAAPNFNRTFADSRGEYFKWIAHDDLCGPEFLARCVEVLDRDPGVVLAYPRTVVVDDAGAEVERPEAKLRTDDASPARRFGDLLQGHKCYEIFGLHRRSALERTPLIGGYPHGDGILLARLALLGRFEEVPEDLHYSRRHDRQSMQFLEEEKWAYVRYAYWFDSARKGRLVFPFWKMAQEYARSLVAADLAVGERLRCSRHLLGWMWRCRRRLRGDVTYALRRLAGRDPLGASPASTDRAGGGSA